MPERTDNTNQPHATSPSEALGLLRLETELHQGDDAHASLLARGLSCATEFWHGSNKSLTKVKGLQAQIQTALDKGDQQNAEKLAAKALDAVRHDKEALESQGTITEYGSGMVKAAGLFVPGKIGMIGTSTAYAFDNIKSGDSFETKVLDGGLGAAKGLVIKASCNFIGEQKYPVAGNAFTFGLVSRFSDLAFSRETFTDSKTGGFDGWGGAKRIVGGTIAFDAVFSDLLICGLAHKAIGALNPATRTALKSSPFWSTTVTGGVYGASTGSVQEMNRQNRAHEDFDIGKIARHAAFSGLTNMVAAAPGGMMESFQATSSMRQGQNSVEAQQTPASIGVRSKSEIELSAALSPQRSGDRRQFPLDGPEQPTIAASFPRPSEKATLADQLVDRHSMPATLNADNHRSGVSPPTEGNVLVISNEASPLGEPASGRNRNPYVVGSHRYSVLKSDLPTTYTDSLRRVVSIYGPDTIGSGFLVSPEGLLITDNHVVRGSDRWKARTADGQIVTARVVASDLANDLSVLAIDMSRLSRQFPFLPELSDAKLGDDIAAVSIDKKGNPNLSLGTIEEITTLDSLRKLPLDGEDPHRQILVGTYPSYPGLSGAPLVRWLDGNVVGVVNGSIRFNSNGFATPAEAVRNLLMHARLKKPSKKD